MFLSTAAARNVPVAGALFLTYYFPFSPGAPITCTVFVLAFFYQSSLLKKQLQDLNCKINSEISFEISSLAGSEGKFTTQSVA